MKLVYLHGPPAAGKFTIAKELETLIGCGIFHNHLTIDAAKPFFAFGTESFWNLVEELRVTCLTAGAKENHGIVVYTSCYNHPEDLGLFEKIEHSIESEGGKILPVYLKCESSELEKRVTSPTRVAMGKVKSVEGLRNQLKTWNCVSVPRESCLTVLTDGKSPLQCAEEIVSVFKLSR